MVEQLKNLLNNEESELTRDVINIILSDGEEDIKGYIENILTHGCASGCVGALIYYWQTEEFFKKHHDEIFELYNQLHEEMGLDIELNSNSLSWLAFEEVTSNIARELNI